MKIGGNTVSKLYLGATAASRAYLGATLVWEADSGFNPASLFASGEPGGIWLPEPQYLFQDRAGTVPVTASGQSVGYRLDSSGRGNHLTAINDAARGTYNTDGTLHWIAYDGVDDGYVSPTITPGTDKLQVFAGVRRLSNVNAIICEAGNNSGSQGAFFLTGETRSFRYTFAPRGNRNGQLDDQANVNGFAAPDTAILTARVDLGAANGAQLRRNGGTFATSTNQSLGAGNFLAWPLYVGRRAGGLLPFNGRDYGMIVRFGPNLDLDTIVQVEAYLGARAGVIL